MQMAQKLQCPHCHSHFVGTRYTESLGKDTDGFWQIGYITCVNESCGRIVVWLREFYGQNEELIRPRVPNRQPIPPEIPESFLDDYREACLVLANSPKASAALSRRCLQHLLREKAKVTAANLYKEIEEVINSQILPSDIADSIDYLRKIGNVAAHPMHNSNTGEIVPVEPGEAEWCLDVIEMLFDYFFVRPAKTEQRRQAFDQKMSAT